MWQRRSSRCGSLLLVYPIPADLANSSGRFDPANSAWFEIIGLLCASTKINLIASESGGFEIRSAISGSIAMRQPRVEAMSHVYLFQIPGPTLEHFQVSQWDEAAQ
ncbi:hypothetical protein BDV09DRAFT_163439 [Aspergillus tetrazonus]